MKYAFEIDSFTFLLFLSNLNTIFNRILLEKRQKIPLSISSLYSTYQKKSFKI